MKLMIITLAILAIGVYTAVAIALNAGFDIASKFLPTYRPAAPVQTTGQFYLGSSHQLQGSAYLLQGGTGINIK